MPANLVYHQVASDNIVVAVNANNPVKTLSKQQIRDIMTGKVKNWSQVGGTNLPIKLYAAAPGQAVQDRAKAFLQRFEHSSFLAFVRVGPKVVPAGAR